MPGNPCVSGNISTVEKVHRLRRQAVATITGSVCYDYNTVKVHFQIITLSINNEEIAKHWRNRVDK